MPSLNNVVMSELLFIFCDPDEQLRIVERLRALEQLEFVLEDDLRITKQVKSGLMQDLLTGGVPVAISESTESRELSANV